MAGFQDRMVTGQVPANSPLALEGILYEGTEGMPSSAMEDIVMGQVDMLSSAMGDIELKVKAGRLYEEMAGRFQALSSIRSRSLQSCQHRLLRMR